MVQRRKIYSSAERRTVFEKMGQALRTTERAIVYEIIDHGGASMAGWAAAAGANVWRTAFDSDRLANAPGEDPPGPGVWREAGLWKAGLEGASEKEARTEMSLAALFAAPLVSHPDVRGMSAATQAILISPAVLAVQQDPLGRPAKLVSKWSDTEIYAKPLADGSYAVGLVNRGGAPARITVNWSQLGWEGRHQARNLSAPGSDLPADTQFSAEVAPHDIILIQVRL